MLFTKILIANRGEIACRVIRTAHRLGISCVAIYSEADTHALHVKLADEAICIGPAPSRESYLQSSAIITAAMQTGAQAIHPGYGFLSENADFAAACAQAGICFIGPPITAIQAMGSKSTAKQIMEKAGVPLVPGYHGKEQDLATFQSAAQKIGYPVLLKAAAGGGGKGMRIVWQATELENALASAKREAQASFADDQILVEKYLTKPRHIEIQVFADSQHNTVHLFERDCSIQRRHQKIIEEAPAPNLSAALRKKMGNAAIAAAQAIGYVGAGTIEFLLDEDGAFYFMEMNTRLQVEHPVTEMITRQDLVEWQIRVAQGEPLPCQQDQLKIHGHAIETRIYAEDPNNDFLPSIGQIKYLTTPAETDHVRLDTGVAQGDYITPYYDPMIAKLIAWDENRSLALQRLEHALNAYQIVGITSNLNLLTKVINHPAFADEQLETGFIPKYYNDLIGQPNINNEVLAFASVYLLQQQKIQQQQLAQASHDPFSPWYSLTHWRSCLPESQSFRFTAEKTYETTLLKQADGYLFTTQQESCQLTDITITQHTVTATINQQKIAANIFFDQQQIYVLLKGMRYQLTLLSNANEQTTEQQAQTKLSAPMPGKVVAILVDIDKEVEPGAGLIVIEAMKMEHTIHAPSKGTVKEWYFQIGDLVDETTELLRFEVKG